MAYQGVFANLEYLGIFDVLLPFLLVFVIVFAVLQKVNIFGPKSKQFNSVIALIMGLAVVYPHVMGHYPPERDIVNIINQSLPNVSVVIVAIVMALIIIGVLGKRFEIGGNSLSGWLALLAFGVVIYIFGAAANWWYTPGWMYFITNPDIMALIITVLVFAIIIWFITKDPDKETHAFKSVGDQFSAMLKEPPR